MSLNYPSFSFVKSHQNANNNHCYIFKHFSPIFTLEIVLREVISIEKNH